MISQNRVKHGSVTGSFWGGGASTPAARPSALAAALAEPPKVKLPPGFIVGVAEYEQFRRVYLTVTRGQRSPAARSVALSTYARMRALVAELRDLLTREGCPRFDAVPRLPELVI